MLERDAEGYVPHAYEQLAAAYRQAGDDRAARNVQLAKQRRHRSTRPWYSRMWGYLQDVTVGYGFRPRWAAAWLAGLLAVGTTVFGLHAPEPLKAASTRRSTRSSTRWTCCCPSSTSARRRRSRRPAGTSGSPTR